jgi:hypothetical protein
MPVAAIAALYVMPYEDVRAFREGPSSLYIYTAIAFLLGSALLVNLFLKGAKRSLVLLLTYFVFIGFFYNAYYMPVTDRASKSLRLITDALGDHAKGKEIYTYGFNSAGIIFYVGRPVNSFMDINEIKDIKHDILLIVEEKPAVNIKSELEKLFLPVKRVKYEKDYYTIYVRRNG